MHKGLYRSHIDFLVAIQILLQPIGATQIVLIAVETVGDTHAGFQRLHQTREHTIARSLEFFSSWALGGQTRQLCIDGLLQLLYRHTRASSGLNLEHRTQLQRLL